MAAAETRRERRRESEENQTVKGIFSNDLIRGILERLPSKSIGRFRCLSKGWLSNLSDSEFINRHAIQAKENPNIPLKLFSCVWSNSLYKLDLETHIDDLTYDNALNVQRIELPAWEQRGKFPRMVGSCNGLLCLAMAYSQICNNSGRIYRGETFLVFNPLTRESGQFSYRCPQSWNLYGPPDASAKTDINLGFGYDSSTKDYKIVRVNSIYNYVFDVFSLKNKCWKKIQQTPLIPPAHRHRTLRDPSIEVGGFLHWQMYDNVVFTFDLAQEKGGELIPDIPNYNRNLFRMVGLDVMEGCLCVSLLKSNSNSGGDLLGELNCVIWMMKEYGVAESWTKVIQLSLPGPSLHRLSLISISYTKKSKVLLLKQDSRGFIYNLQDNSNNLSPFQNLFRELLALRLWFHSSLCK